jgi:glycosyltransferase involved in cell wall biosynthesis
MVRASRRDPGGPLVMVTGATPPDVCGVGDYTDRLVSAAPASWQLFVERDWSLRRSYSILRRLLRRQPADVVVQYPTQGYGWSLVPHFLILAGRVTRRYRPVLALHEFGSLTAKARAALALASHAASHVIFTTEVERDRAKATRLFPSRVPTSIIGILSNIPAAAHQPAFSARSIDIAYFGHIRPNKGLETFLDVIAEVRKRNPSLRSALIGEVPVGYEGFARMVDARCQGSGTVLTTGLDDDAAATVLADVRLLYLPFPDGVSARRGSVLAGFGNGALVASSVGTATPAGLLSAIIPCRGTRDDVAVLEGALRSSDAQAAVLQHAGRVYVDTMLPRDWSQMAALYDAVLGRSC